MLNDEQLKALFGAIDTYTLRFEDSDRERIATYVESLLAAERERAIEECVAKVKHEIDLWATEAAKRALRNCVLALKTMKGASNG